ncbi:Glucose--fructose oxidoreductase precursor [Pirellulimonas nuda]|uniref:Glucose--fructose oxidoreductase n=1 Tax=Pirellulimonas nuda TaxID=2528009 RepID=A0A518DBH2_9BACT|nr:Gfo/Idh/MocA family oxidoreductase [Pirellulimonas nuda]QDU88822.1 Glucose--fructose oxidoreductase precursor [Pirellulimonas nuda]
MERRHFLQAGIAALAANAVGSHAFARNVDKRPRVGLIGAGWYGKTDLYALCQVAQVEVVGLADPDSQMLDQAALRAAGWHGAKTPPHKYRDYREMLRDHEFDIVLIGTPDHWHALPMIHAVQQGADVYCQKPISVDVVEGQAMLSAARRHERVVQVGMQRRSTPHLVQAVEEVIEQDLLGKIGHVEICCYYHMRSNRNVESIEPPPHLDYDLWTGPAPMRPYNPLVHPRQWRLFTEYGNGIMGDMGVHMLDMVRWMLKLGWPTRISSSGGIYVDRGGAANIPDTQTATFTFPEFNAVWTHRTWGNSAKPDYPWGAYIYGEKGTLKASVSRWEFEPYGKGKKLGGEVVEEFDKYPQDLDQKDLDPSTAVANRQHQRDFLKAIQERSRPVADIEQGHISAASCILANLSMQLGRELAWDPKKRDVIDDADASKLLARPYREPWTHPQPVDA